jgi:hypothetical protein
MWILKWLPFWIFYATFFVGLLGFIATYLLRFVPIPALFMYKTPIQIVSAILMVVGVYMSGAISNEEAWLAKVKELEVKVAQAEAKSQEVNVQVVEKVVTKTQVVRERGKDIVQYVDREVVKYDSKCEIPKEAVTAVNSAAEGVKK